MPGLNLKMVCNRPVVCVVAWFLAIMQTTAGLGAARDATIDRPVVHTNQSYIEEVSARSTLKIGDMTSVFAYVFASLPQRVKVYPTENYYYFSFYNDGVAFAGNIRLDASDRDRGLVDFTYFPAFSGWRQDDIDTYKQFTLADGVKIEKVKAFAYRVTFRQRSVLFELNDLSKVVPPPGVLNADERYLGPVYDESGIQFFLVFNQRLKMFQYILNETGPFPDELYPSRISDRIVIGRRTGFAYYRDDLKPRKILIGVYEGNVIANNYFDGPFDQLPDNFLHGQQLKTAIVAASLAPADQIDRLGLLPGGTDRVLIKPYITYDYLDDLEIFSDCAHDKSIARKYYYECFVVDDNASAADGFDPPVQTPPEKTDARQLGVQPGSIHHKLHTPAQHGLLRQPGVPAAYPVLHTNQQFIEEMQAKTSLKIDDIADVFAMVLQQLPATAQVYPTENYYYFSFFYKGMDYSGNLRLAVTDRDAGKIHFTYFPAYNGWRRDAIDTYKIFGSADGVDVSKVDELNYRVTYRGKSVLFALNNLAAVAPPPALMNADETYIGPVFDESGMQFYLLYNSRLKVFHYILNETQAVPDQLDVSDVSPRIVIGRRSGFAFYLDKNKDRKILIGVFAENSNVNNYLDGPFDQLPDNFIRGESLRKALVDFVPELKGTITRYGFWKGKESRFLIGPYYYYSDPGQLAMFDECATSPDMSGDYYYKCFLVQDEPRD